MARRYGLHLAMPLAIAMTAICGYRAAAQEQNQFDDLTEGKRMHGFRTVALFLDDADKPMGARFIHERTGFTLDLLHIQSIPQGFIWVNSFPTSDMGEPHTQEHLLLGKGNKGRYVANLEDMSLTTSSAFTQQWRTCYHFNTGAGPEIYYDQFEKRLDAMLHPDYTDEEIRREVCNFGVSEDPDGKLRLEEKGTVYNEMVRTFDNPWVRMSRVIDTVIYGKDHPLAYVSGGAPEAIRVMQPEAIRLFHRQHYYLGNMGAIGSMPKEMGLSAMLKRHDEILNRLQPKSVTPEPIMTPEKLPAPKMAPAGGIYIADYPNKNEGQPGPVLFAWPAVLKLDPHNRLMANFFVSNIAGDAGTNLYKLFIDTKTRQMDVGAQEVFGWVNTDQGNVFAIGLGDYPAANMTETKLGEIRGKIIEELKRIASWKDGSPELVEFNTRVMNRIIGERRDLAKFVNSPPGFGSRGVGSTWLQHIDLLGELKEFRKSVTLKSELDRIEKLLGTGKNVWRDYIAAWKLTSTLPYATAARPSPELIKREDEERKERIQAEVNRLKKKYGVSDDQEVIRRYRAEYDAETEKIDRLAATVATPKFIDSPPLTLDDQLDYKVTTIRDNIPMVASTFDNMTSATVGLALKLNCVPENEYLYLSILPNLLTGSGVIENGKPVSYDEMTERLRKEILNLSAYFSVNSKTGRCELVIRGAGNDLAETERSLDWMRLVLFQPDWRVENLPRLRDLVDQSVSNLRGMMLGPEERWVHNPAGAYRWQENKLLLATESFLTRAHNAHRLRWLLKDAGSATEREAISAFLLKLAAAGDGSERDKLKTLLASLKGDGPPSTGMDEYRAMMDALPAGAKGNALDAVKDLDLLLSSIPDGSLAADWRYLCNQMRHDLLVAPEKTLADLNTLRRRVLKSPNARMFMIGSRANQAKLAEPIGELLSGLENTPVPVLAASNQMLLNDRLRERVQVAGKPTFVGLVNPNTGSGVFIHSASAPSYHDTARAVLLDYLAYNLYAGGGAHGIFMKTWGAGLAYSNGLGSNPANGRYSYYAERCPELPQTLRFVIDELKKAKPDPGLVEYAIAQAFGDFRSGSSYESRGESMAADLADGLTPEVVSRFRRAILSLRSTPNLVEELYKRKDKVYEKLLPGYGVKMESVTGGFYYVIGPEKQLQVYEEYLKSVEGPDTELYRIYPRDYWMPLEDEDIGMRNE